MHFKKIVLPALLFSFISVGFRCNKDVVPNEERVYSFREKVIISPYQLNYLEGDTIWLRVLIPGKRLYDEKTNTRILYDSVSFTSYVSVELVYNNPFIGTGSNVSFVFPRGISGYVGDALTRTSANIVHGCNQYPDYDLQLGIVLLKKGVFDISFYNATLGNCSGRQFPIAGLNYSFDVADVHKSFYQSLPFQDVGRLPDPYVLSRLDEKRSVVINVQ